ncbi:MAG: hypothetical protein Fur0023_08000 [Bacteroidia bacterium]
MYKKLIYGICAMGLFVNIFAQKNNITAPDTSGKKMTIKGIVEKGVEAGCTILKTKENKIYLLLNLKTTVNYGSCIKATGYIQKNHVGICMQGTPFYVINYCPCNKKSKPKYQRELPKDKTTKERN